MIFELCGWIKCTAQNSTRTMKNWITHQNCHLVLQHFIIENLLWPFRCKRNGEKTNQKKTTLFCICLSCQQWNECFCCFSCFSFSPTLSLSLFLSPSSTGRHSIQYAYEFRRDVLSFFLRSSSHTPLNAWRQTITNVQNCSSKYFDNER